MRGIVPALCAVAMLAAFTAPVRAATPLHKAAVLTSNPAVIEALIAGGADPKACTERGFTPLHAAAKESDNPAILETLIAAGADMKARTRGGKTPFHYAKDNKALQGTDVYWRLNEARFE